MDSDSLLKPDVVFLSSSALAGGERYSGFGATKWEREPIRDKESHEREKKKERELVLRISTAPLNCIQSDFASANKKSKSRFFLMFIFVILFGLIYFSVYLLPFSILINQLFLFTLAPCVPVRTREMPLVWGIFTGGSGASHAPAFLLFLPLWRF